MDVKDIIVPERVTCRANVSSKKRALELLSELLAHDSALNSQQIFESLLTREKLGTTSLGHGVALPHGRQQASEQTVGAFVMLEQGIDYDAVDGVPVDLLFALLVPKDSTDQHLQLLAQLAEMFNNEVFRQQLRDASNNHQAYKLLTSGP
jgi:PTS system nitrogen regulatory IIA component